MDFTGQTVSHYQIISKLGAGGMGVVYKAEDTRLKRLVAIKFLPDGSGGHGAALERFQREARAASALNHPHICTIFDIGHHEGSPFIVMELLKGQNLSATIGKKPMPIDQILTLGEQIADALEAAHAEKIVHRDVKPANIFVTERHQAKLLDFGLAKLTAPDRVLDSVELTKSRENSLTETGITIGTVTYMSPEQARAEDLDARTDLYSFGVVLYEMATGTPPFPGKSTGEILEAIFTQQPVSPVRLNHQVPAELERIIAKAMEKDRNLRYQNAADIRADLQRLKRDTSALSHPATTRTRMEPPPLKKSWTIAAIVILAIAISLLSLRQDRKVTPVQAPPKQTPKVVEQPRTAIAVLPFVNMSDDQDQEYFSDGLTEELLNALARNPKLRVSSRTSAFSFKGKEANIKTIAETLNVTHVLEGSVRKSGSKLRITAQLIEVATDSHLWSQAYDRQMDNAFAVQEDIATSVAAALKAQLQAGRNVYTPHPDAYKAYLQGRFFVERFPKEDLMKALGYYEEACRIDPGYAAAWAGQAHVYTRLADSRYIPTKEGNQKALELAEKARELDPESADSYMIVGWIQRVHEWDWAGADRSYKRAFELEPGSARVLRGAAFLAGCMGRLEEAIRLDRMSVDMDPISIPSHSALAIHLVQAGRFQEAEAAFGRIEELDPQAPFLHGSRGVLYILMHNLKSALSDIEQEQHPQSRLFDYAMYYHAAGKKKEADAALAKFTEQYGQFPDVIAALHAFRGENDRAFYWLDLAYKQHSNAFMPYLKTHRLFRNLHPDPRWPALLKKMNLPLD